MLLLKSSYFREKANLFLNKKRSYIKIAPFKIAHIKIIIIQNANILHSVCIAFKIAPMTSYIYIKSPH